MVACMRDAMGATTIQAARLCGVAATALPQRPRYIERRSRPAFLCSCQHRPSQQPSSVPPNEPSSSSQEPNNCPIVDFPPSTSLSNVQAFSRLSHVEWDLDTVVSFMVSYLSIFHVPLGLGGLTILAQQLNVKDLAPQIKAMALVIIELLELGGTIWLVRSSMKQSKRTFKCFSFHLHEASGSRGWVATAVAGLTLILVAMGATACVIESLHLTMPAEGKGEVLRQMTSGDFITELSTFLAFCILTPCLEEIVYRGYLLQSMASRFGWQWAVFWSSLAFTLAHFDIIGAPSLFFIGCVLGVAYTWSGNLVELQGQEQGRCQIASPWDCKVKRNGDGANTNCIACD